MCVRPESRVRSLFEFVNFNSSPRKEQPPRFFYSFFGLLQHRQCPKIQTRGARHCTISGTPVLVRRNKGSCKRKETRLCSTNPGTSVWQYVSVAYGGQVTRSVKPPVVNWMSTRCNKILCTMMFLDTLALGPCQCGHRPFHRISILKKFLGEGPKGLLQ